MKNKLTIVALLTGCFLTCLIKTGNAQDARFTQFYQNPLLLNPAIMGASNSITAGLCYRNQWGTVSNGYSSYSFNGMYPIYFNTDENGKMDAGLSVMEDKAGAFTTLSALAAVDYTRQIVEDQYLCLSLIGGYGQQAISTGNLTFDDQYVRGAYSASNPSDENLLSKKKGYADVGFGFTWYMNPSRQTSKVNAYLGIAAFHLNRPNLSMTGSVSKLPIRMAYEAGLKIFESDAITVVPNVMLQTQGGNTEAAFGSYLDYLFNNTITLTVGLWYRRNDAIGILVGGEYKGVSLGYSYDAVTSTISANVASGMNANEITLTYRLPQRSSGGTTASFISSTGTQKSSSGSSGAGVNPSPFPHF